MERTLFIFRNGDIDLLSLNNQFFSLAVLLNRLLSENYTGKKIKFINFYLMTEETYRLHPKAIRNYTHDYGGMLWYNDVFDVVRFEALDHESQKEFLWKRAHEILKEASIKTKNGPLLDACEYAYNKGLETYLYLNYKLIEANIVLGEQPIEAAIWVDFRLDGMYSRLTLKKDERILFEKPIDNCRNGVSFFLEMYKKIEVQGDFLIIKGHRDVEYLPLKFPISQLVFDKNI